MLSTAVMLIGQSNDITILVSVGQLMLVGGAAALGWKAVEGLLLWHKAFVMFMHDHNLLMRDYYERHPEARPEGHE